MLHVSTNTAYGASMYDMFCLFGAFEGGTSSTNVNSCSFPDSSPDGGFKLTNAHWTHVRHNQRHVEVLADVVLSET